MQEFLLKLTAALLLTIAVVLTSVQIMVNNDHFFAWQFIKNDVTKQTKIEHSELMRILDEIQAYLFGRRADFIIYGEIAGERRQVFNAREIAHMHDVRVLFKYGIILRNSCALVGGILLFTLWRKKKELLFNTLFFSALVFLILALVGGLLLYFDFNRYFVLFHEIFFTNDLWILDPRTSILINMVPIEFFISIVKAIGLISVSGMLLIGALGALGKYRLRSRQL
ncbi:MAG: TIGR01906 family membrane protein [Firmicutes bacterium]|nr:TIGR01906 family membrane protein [Bacillota bacterium]